MCSVACKHSYRAETSLEKRCLFVLLHPYLYFGGIGDGSMVEIHFQKEADVNFLLQKKQL